jgi:prophage antirepressor-like protein
MNAVVPFNFRQHNIRVVRINGEPWFVAGDACALLQLKGYASQHTRRLAEHQVKVLNRDSRISDTSLPALFAVKAPTVSVVSEGGLYRLIMSSRIPGPRSSRTGSPTSYYQRSAKDGMYVKGEEKVVTGELSEDELVAKAMSILQRKVERLQQEKAQLAAENAALRRAQCRDAHRAEPSDGW